MIPTNGAIYGYSDYISMPSEKLSMAIIHYRLILQIETTEIQRYRIRYMESCCQQGFWGKTQK
jgi:hypothetical protein